MNVAIIPARGGSKRIPRKNIREFCGKPMIAWPIEAARESGCFAHIMVSTDDEEIAEVAGRCGAEAPFRRPSELADDVTPTVPVIAHAVDRVAEMFGEPEAVCCIYATTPLLRADDLLAGLARLSEGDCSYVLAVTRYAAPIQRALRRDRDGRLSMFQPEHICTRSQDLEKIWHDAAQFYWARPDTWRREEAIFGVGAIGIELPRFRVQDIDDEDDWRRAELMFAALNGR